MNCRRCEAIWNELLDRPAEGRSTLEQAVEAHASTCERCRGISARYQVLRQAGSVLRPPPSPSPGSMERLHALTVPPTLAREPKRLGPWYRVAMASAAALFAVAWLGRPGPAPEGLAPRSVPPPSSAVDASRPLGKALAEATEATLDLAREASAPASRIGRDVLDPAASEAVAGPTAAVDSSAPGVLQSVGERVGAGVGPISGSARHAFSFLLGPPPEPAPAPRESRGSL